MPARSPIQLITLPGWKGGLNRDADPYQLTISESPDALNVNFGIRGSVSKRKGYAEWDATPDEVCRAICTWKKIGGSEYLIYVGSAGQIWSGTAAPLTEQSTHTVGAATDAYDYPVGCAALNDVVYVTARNATNPRSFNGTSWSSETASDFDGSSSVFPKAAFISTHHDRIFAANVNSASSGIERSRVYYSDPRDAETWPANNFFDFDPDDGTEITGMAALGEQLIIFKDHSVQMLTGKSEVSFTRYVIESQIGTTASGSIATLGGFMYFFDPSTGVWVFDGAGFTQLDENIHDYLLDGMNSSYAYKAFGWIWDNRYYLSVPWGSDTYPSRTFVLDLVTRAWTEYDYGVPAAADLGGTLLGGSPGNVTEIHTLETGTDDDGSGITAYFRTAWLAPDESPTVKHRTRRLDTTWEAIGNHSVTMNMYRDFRTDTAYATESLDTNPPSGTWDEVAIRSTGLGNARWRTVAFEFKTTGSTEEWTLNRLAIVLSSLSRVRGED